MLTNRSVPVDTLLPHIIYQDVAQAIAWLGKAFGFEEHYRYGDPNAPNGAQVRFGKVYFMLRQARPSSDTPAKLGSSTQSLTVFVEEVDQHYRRARSAGVKIVEDLNETHYGERQYGAVDLDGHHWLFSCHVRDISPQEWGAQIAES